MQSENLNAVDAFQKTIRRLKGAFALAVLVAGEADMMLVARQGPPLAIAHGDGEIFVGSDAYALAPFSQKITYLQDGRHGCSEAYGLSNL